MIENLAAKYQSLHDDVLTKTSDHLRDYIKSCLDDLPNIDNVAARAKSPERFAAKALKQIDGSFKYKNPLSEIQDLIGARVTVLYLSDIDHVRKVIDGYFNAIEWQDKMPESDSEFGYFGNHYILPLPDDVIPEGEEGRAPKFFELQIKTLFQHAWSEAHHDIGYKAPRDLSSLERRQMAFSAAQAWGADQIFEALVKDIANGKGNQ